MLTHIELTKEELKRLFDYLQEIRMGPDSVDKKLYNKLKKIIKKSKLKNERK